MRAHVGGFAIVYAGLVAAATLAAGILIQPLARARPARHVAVAGLLAGGLGFGAGRLATTAGSPAAVLGAAVLLGIGYGACLIAGLRWIEATTLPAIRGRVTGIFYVLAYLGFWAPTLMAVVAARIGDGATFWLTAGLAVATAAVAALRRWRSDEPGPVRDRAGSR